MLVITITLVGFSYTYISGIITGKTSDNFSVVDTFGYSVTISNDGTAPITSFSSVIIDGNPAIFRVSKQNPSLVGYWKMDESAWVNDCNTKSVIDSSGNSNDGRACPALTGPTGGAPGKFGNAGSFDGINDMVDTTKKWSSFTGQTLTVSMWVKRNILNAGQAIIGDSNGIVQIIYTTTQIRVGQHAYTSEAVAPVTDTNWHHIVGYGAI